MTSRVLLVAATTGYQTRAFAEAADRLGLVPVLATDRCHILDDPWGDHAVAVRFEEPVGSAERLAEALRAGPPVLGVVGLSDRPAEIAAAVAERLGLPFHPVAAVAASRNKFLSRERFRDAGLPVPAYARWPLDQNPAEIAATVAYPCVLKPLGLSASRGVIRADDPAQFRAAFERIRALLGRPEIRRLRDAVDEYIQVEEYLPGREFAIEGLLTAGRLEVVALFDKPDPLEGPYFEETIYVAPSRAPAEWQQEMVSATERAIAALGLMHGPVHAEVRVGAAGVFVLEVAARPIGGLCAHALRFADGASWEEVILRHAIGETSGSRELLGPATGVMMIPIPSAGVYQGVEGEEEARNVANITDVQITAKSGQRLVPLPEGASYLGFLFARATEPDVVERALRTAHGHLSFAVTAALPVL